jgi:hypothetical protein
MAIVLLLKLTFLSYFKGKRINNKDTIAKIDALSLKIKFDLFFLPISLKIRKLSSRARKIIL